MCYNPKRTDCLPVRVLKMESLRLEDKTILRARRLSALAGWELFAERAVFRLSQRSPRQDIAGEEFTMKSIRGKILFYMLMTVLVLLSILGLTSVSLTYISSRTLLEQTMGETAQIAAVRVEQELISYANVATDAGAVARLADFSQGAQAKQEIINQWCEAHGFIRGNIIGTDGKSIFDGTDYSDRDYFNKSMQGNTCISDPLLSRTTGKISIIVSAPLWEGGVPGSKVVGVVYFVPQETFLNDIVSKVNISEHSAAYAINADGMTIADNTIETIMVQNIEKEAQSDASLKSLAQIHTKMRQGESGFDSYVINGVRKFSAYAPIPGTAGTNGWSIGLTAPQADFLGSTNLAIICTGLLLLVSVVVASVIAYRLANGIGVPIKQCADRLRALAEGDMHSPIPQIKKKDETGILAEATEKIVSTTRDIITDMGWGLGEMADGNFEIESNSQHLYIGDFQPLAASMYKIMEQLTATLLRIDGSAEQVASGSEQVSVGAQALSQGTTEQASSTEELAATIADILRQVRETAQNAEEAHVRSIDSGKETEVCNRQMQEMISAMNEIEHKSTEIGNIIKTIEDIAFQTNILALNAAVEAARAGVAGKGFAVVADEVRNLASKSAEASKSTSALIEGSVKAVHKGTQIANDTAESLSKVVESAQTVSHLVDQIAAAAAEQSNAIEQVTVGVDQISSVVQTNSATAEQSAAASEELSQQAQMLKNLVAKFKLRRSQREGSMIS